MCRVPASARAVVGGTPAVVGDDDELVVSYVVFCDDAADRVGEQVDRRAVDVAQPAGGRDDDRDERSFRGSARRTR